MNKYNTEGKDIRFIDSHYKELFKVPDGRCIQVQYKEETVIKPCKFIDEYHTRIGNRVFHICQFAEIMEANGNIYTAEPEITGDEAAWKVGMDRILAIQTYEKGYDYTLFDNDYNEIDGGQLDNPDKSMIEIRQDILESFGLDQCVLHAMVYEEVMAQAFEVSCQSAVVKNIAYTKRMLEISTAHIKPETSTRLKNDPIDNNLGLCVYEKGDYGFYI